MGVRSCEFIRIKKIIPRFPMSVTKLMRVKMTNKWICSSGVPVYSSESLLPLKYSPSASLGNHDRYQGDKEMRSYTSWTILWGLNHEYNHLYMCQCFFNWERPSIVFSIGECWVIHRWTSDFIAEHKWKSLS